MTARGRDSECLGLSYEDMKVLRLGYSLRSWVRAMGLFVKLRYTHWRWYSTMIPGCVSCFKREMEKLINIP